MAGGGATPGHRHRDPEVERTLFEAEIFVEQARLKLRLLPDGWHSFERVPVRPRKTKVTAALDADMVDWFRLTGEGWHGRINHVLRVFMLSVQSKEILTDRDYDWRGRRLARRR
ncbi:MAG: BrnA antitoxin family protein [Amaricoccus sp.]